MVGSIYVPLSSKFLHLENQGPLGGLLGAENHRTMLSTHFDGYQQGFHEAEFSKVEQNPEALPRDSLWNQLRCQTPCFHLVVPLKES